MIRHSNRATQKLFTVAEIEIRDRLVACLTKKLEQHGSDLASTKNTLSRRKITYNVWHTSIDKKGHVVQYLVKPPGSSEQAALLLVLLTMLQFDETIEEGKQKVSWWGDIIPTCLTGPEALSPAPLRSSLTGEPSLPTSAVVTISSMSSIKEDRTSILMHTSALSKCITCDEHHNYLGLKVTSSLHMNQMTMK
ncbi:hypothetical protein HJC23_007851 [Cyclotella cryptica]|uniref:LAGLIDADG homing endonuclease n=1 Tax=Cyclotella cryptica TaxID=29204 RepID=A0ABD3RED0_9STRA